MVVHLKVDFRILSKIFKYFFKIFLVKLFETTQCGLKSIHSPSRDKGPLNLSCCVPCCAHVPCPRPFFHRVPKIKNRECFLVGNGHKNTTYLSVSSYFGLCDFYERFKYSIMDFRF